MMFDKITRICMYGINHDYSTSNNYNTNNYNILCGHTLNKNINYDINNNYNTNDNIKITDANGNYTADLIIADIH